MVTIKILKNTNNYLSKFISYPNKPSKLVIYERNTSRNKGEEMSIEFIEMSDYEWMALKEAI